MLKKIACALIITCLLAGPVLAKKSHSQKSKGESSLIHKLNATLNHLPRSPMIRLLPKQQQNLCTALAIYEESRGLIDYEKFLVVQTIKAREEKQNKTACQILAQSGQFPWVKKLNRKWQPDETDAWYDAQNMAITARYTQMFNKPTCPIEYFSVGMYSSHRRNLLCSMHLAGHYYYALRSH